MLVLVSSLPHTYQSSLTLVPQPMIDRTLFTPGLDKTRLFISLTAGAAGAGTRCMRLLSSSPRLSTGSWW